MKTHAIYLIVIVALFLLVGWLSTMVLKANTKIDQQSSVIAEKNATIEYRTNEFNRVVGEKQAAEVRYKDLEASYPDIVESIKKDFDLKLRDVKAYIRNEFQARGTGQGTIITHNHYDSSAKRTTRFRDFSMDDGFLKFDTRLYDSLSSSLYSYVYSDTAKTAVHSKKKWFLGKESLYSSTTFSNPNARIIGTTNVLVNNYRDKRWAIMIGGYYDPFFNRGGVAITGGYTLFKF